MHNIHAILGPVAALLNDPPLISPGRAIPLKQGMAMIPVDGAFYEAKCGDAPPSVIDTFEFLTPAFLDWLRTASRGHTLVYVETDYFGGVGNQGAVVMHDGACVHGPAFGEDKHINEALGFLGIGTSDDMDAFDLVGLGQHRTTDEWIHASEPRRDG